MKRLKPIMLGGTGSDVGKSMLAAGLCRIFLQDGYHPAPFKAQNMALNSYATPDGREIGRAQAVQAEAAGLPCSTDMNPILLKPTGDKTTQVILDGMVDGNTDAWSYFRKEGRERLREHANAAFHRLAARYNPIVMEGAGSISEINLRETDLVNMPMAREADANVLLVADIDRGGVFASAYGSIMLQTEEDRRRIKGIIINKFRGDIRLFDEGRRMMEEICGVPVIGVVPYRRDIHIEEEDSLALSGKSRRAVAGKVNMAVVLLPHLSNFTDFNRLELDPRVNLYYAASGADLQGADVVILPGTKSTIADLAWLRKHCIDKAIAAARNRGATVMGICGGYQMMGVKILDPDGVESEVKESPGLGMLPCETVLLPGKTTRQVGFTLAGSGTHCSGYEIHAGATDTHGATPLCILDSGEHDGCVADSHCFGTYIHGILDNDTVVDRLIALHSDEPEMMRFDYRTYRESQYDALAAQLRESLDIDLLYKIMSRDD